MRFAFCIFKYCPDGGIHTDLMQISRESLRRGHQVKIFTLNWDAPLLESAAAEMPEVEVIPGVGLNQHVRYEHFAGAVHQAVAADEFDVVVGFDKMPGLDLYSAGDTCYLEKVYTRHNSWYRLLPGFKSFQKAEAAVFAEASRTEIMMVSEAEQQVYQRHYRTAADRFHPLPPGMEWDGMAPYSVDLIERFVRSRKPLLVFTLFKYFPYGGLQRDFMRIAREAHCRGYDILVYCIEWLADVPDFLQVIVVETAGIYNHVRYAGFADFVQEDVRWRRPVAIIGFNRMPGLDLYYAADSCFEHKARSMRSTLYRRTKRYKTLSKFEQAVFGPVSNTHVMLITESQREVFQRYYQTPQERLSTLPPGVNRDRAQPENWRQLRVRVRDELALADDVLLMLMIGSGFITKGLDRLLLMLAALPEELARHAHLLVIGQDNPRRFLRQARALGVLEQLTIQTGRDDIPAILQAADLMVHPAYMESGGMVLIEAVIAGLPVIASGACGFAHYINEADAGVVLAEPFEQTALNCAVSAALSDTPRRERWRDNGVAFGRIHDELYDMPVHAMDIIEANITRRHGVLAADLHKTAQKGAP